MVAAHCAAGNAGENGEEEEENASHASWAPSSASRCSGVGAGEVSALVFGAPWHCRRRVAGHRRRRGIGRARVSVGMAADALVVGGRFGRFIQARGAPSPRGALDVDGGFGRFIQAQGASRPRRVKAGHPLPLAVFVLVRQVAATCKAQRSAATLIEGEKVGEMKDARSAAGSDEEDRSRSETDGSNDATRSMCDVYDAPRHGQPGTAGIAPRGAPEALRLLKYSARRTDAGAERSQRRSTCVLESEFTS